MCLTVGDFLIVYECGWVLELLSVIIIIVSLKVPGLLDRFARVIRSILICIYFCLLTSKSPRDYFVKLDESRDFCLCFLNTKASDKYIGYDFF